MGWRGWLEAVGTLLPVLLLVTCLGIVNVWGLGNLVGAPLLILLVRQLVARALYPACGPHPVCLPGPPQGPGRS